MSALTEAGTSRFAKIREGSLDLQVHYNDAGSGETVFRQTCRPLIVLQGVSSVQVCTAWTQWLLCANDVQALVSRVFEAMVADVSSATTGLVETVTLVHR